MSTVEVDDGYAYWRAKLADQNGRVPVTEHPECGFFRYRRDEGAAMVPIAFWIDDDGVVCSQTDAGDVIDDEKVNRRLWLWACKHPVTHDDYLAALSTGVWPDDANATYATQETDDFGLIGHNQPPIEDRITELTRRVTEETARVADWIAQSKGGERDCNQAANWIPDLRTLEKEVVEAFDAEKEPVRIKSQEIDERWRPVKGAAADLKKRLTDFYQKIAAAERARLQKIAQDKAIAEAEALRAKQKAEREERERQEAEARAAAAANPDEPSMFDEAPPPATPEPEPEVIVPAVVPEVKVSFGGARAAKIGVKTATKTAVVTDYVAAATALIAANNLDVKAAIDKAAQKIIKAGGSLPGVVAQ